MIFIHSSVSLLASSPGSTPLGILFRQGAWGRGYLSAAVQYKGSLVSVNSQVNAISPVFCIFTGKILLQYHVQFFTACWSFRSYRIT